MSEDRTGEPETGEPETGEPETGDHGLTGLDASTTNLGARTDERLAGLDGLPVDEHLAVYDAVHEDLRAALHQAHDAHDANDPHDNPRPPSTG